MALPRVQTFCVFPCIRSDFDPPINPFLPSSPPSPFSCIPPPTYFFCSLEFSPGFLRSERPLFGRALLLLVGLSPLSPALLGVAVVRAPNPFCCWLFLARAHFFVFSEFLWAFLERPCQRRGHASSLFPSFCTSPASPFFDCR